MKKLMVMLICITAVVIAAGKPETVREIGSTRIIMTDTAGMPLDNGFYNVEFLIYDSSRDGRLILSHTAYVESKNGVCEMCSDKLAELELKGYREVWVALVIEDQPETKFRTRVFLDPPK